MDNYVQPGKTLTLVAPYDRLSGEGMLVGLIFGVAATNVSSGADVEADLEGVFDLTRETGAGAWTVGLDIFWDNSNKRATHVSTGNKRIGTAVKAALTGDATGQVRLEPGARKAATVAAIATADGSDAATTQALANATKTSVNAILTALKNAGIML